jgi:ribosomal protein L28
MKANTRIKLRGKYNPTNSSRKKANLQYAVDPKTGKRLLVCTKCLRTLSKTKKK